MSQVVWVNVISKDANVHGNKKAENQKFSKEYWCHSSFLDKKKKEKFCSQWNNQVEDIVENQRWRVDNKD